MRTVKIWWIWWTVIGIYSCKASKNAISLIPEEEYKKVEKIYPEHNQKLRNCFQAYMDASDFLDSTGFVSAQSVEQFKALFVDNAKVWNDYLWVPKMEYAVDYADQVFYLHRVRGLKVAYEKDVLEQLKSLELREVLISINKEEDGKKVYKYKINTRKDVYYILNKEQKVIYYDEPIIHHLSFYFLFDETSDEFKILDILPFTIEDK